MRSQRNSAVLVTIGSPHLVAVARVASMQPLSAFYHVMNNLVGLQTMGGMTNALQLGIQAPLRRL